MRVLITGGCGYVGHSVLQHLLTDQSISHVSLYDNLYRKNTNFFLGDKFTQSHKIEFLKGDILDNYSLTKAMKNIDIVIHLAAKVSTPFTDNQVHEFDQVNNWGTANVVEAVEKTPSVKTLIYLSSAAVYGDSKGKTVDEGSLASPKSNYGISKLNAESHIKRLNQKIDTYILRSGNVFGYNPCIRLDAVINKLMFDAEFNGKIEIHGSGDQKRAFVSVNCIGQYIAKLCTNAKIEPNIYNLVNYNISVNEITDEVIKLYPDIDILFLDQHLEMRSVSVKSKFDIDFKDCFNEIGFHLLDMKRNFRF